MGYDFEIITTLSDSKRTKVYLVSLRNSPEQFAILKKHRDSDLLDCYRRIESLQSEYFPKIYDVWEEDSEINVLEEYICGETLQERMKREPLLQESEITLYLRELCQALQVLHHANPPIIHRDIKPDNVMLTDAGGIRLLDFDASRQYKEESERDTVLLGTKEYASPEQFGFMQTDARSDIYSWGIVYSEMLEHGQVSRRYAKRAQKIIDRATMFDPQKRYPDTDTLLKDLAHPEVATRILPICIAVSLLCLPGVVVMLRTGEPEKEPAAHTGSVEMETQETPVAVVESKEPDIVTEESEVQKLLPEDFRREEAVPLEEAYHYVSIEEEVQKKYRTIMETRPDLYTSMGFEDDYSGEYSDNQETVIGREYTTLRFLKSYPRDIVLHDNRFEGMEIKDVSYCRYLEEEGMNDNREFVQASYYTREFGNVVSIAGDYLGTLEPGAYTFTVNVEGEADGMAFPFYLVVHGEEEAVDNFRLNTLNDVAYYSSESENDVVFYVNNTPYPIEEVWVGNRVLETDKYQLVDDGFGVVFSGEMLKKYEDKERVDILMKTANGKWLRGIIIYLNHF